MVTCTTRKTAAINKTLGLLDGIEEKHVNI